MIHDETFLRTEDSKDPMTSQVIVYRNFYEIEKEFVRSLSTSQRQEFARCKLKDVIDAIERIQHEQGPRKKLRNLARIQPFIEAMDGYEKELLNITMLGLGYIWVCSVPFLRHETANTRALKGSIKFVLQVFSFSSSPSCLSVFY